jgi:hypothetical protein
MDEASGPFGFKKLWGFGETEFRRQVRSQTEVGNEGEVIRLRGATAWQARLRQGYGVAGPRPHCFGRAGVPQQANDCART